MKKTYGPYNQYAPYEDVVYRLTGYYAYQDNNATYPRFDVRCQEESIHRAFEAAHQRMLSLVDPNNNKYNIVWQSFYISEVPIGINCDHRIEGQNCHLYDGKGEFVAETKVSSVPDHLGNREIYWGREREDIKFDIGDVVEVRWRDHVELHMIWDLPFDESHARARMPKEKPDEAMPFHLDDSDDCYITVNLRDDYPDHVNVMSCSPATTLPLDETIVTRLKEVFDRCKAEAEKERLQR